MQPDSGRITKDPADDIFPNTSPRPRLDAGLCLPVFFNLLLLFISVYFYSFVFYLILFPFISGILYPLFYCYFS